MARRAKVTGGAKLAAFMRASKRAGAAKPKAVDVGFHDKAIAERGGESTFHTHPPSR